MHGSPGLTSCGYIFQCTQYTVYDSENASVETFALFTMYVVIQRVLRTPLLTFHSAET